jgi:hypothetical protein
MLAAGTESADCRFFVNIAPGRGIGFGRSKKEYYRGGNDLDWDGVGANVRASFHAAEESSLSSAVVTQQAPTLSGERF